MHYKFIIMASIRGEIYLVSSNMSILDFQNLSP